MFSIMMQRPYLVVALVYSIPPDDNVIIFLVFKIMAHDDERTISSLMYSEYETLKLRGACDVHM